MIDMDAFEFDPEDRTRDPLFERYGAQYGEVPTEPIAQPDPNAPTGFRSPVFEAFLARRQRERAIEAGETRDVHRAASPDVVRAIICRTTTGNVMVHVLDTVDALELERVQHGL